MRYKEIIEAPQYTELVSRLNRSVEKTAEDFIEKLIKDWRREATMDRRRQLGYHPYADEAPGSKPFNQADYDAANRDWDTDVDWIGDNLNKLLDDPENAGHHPVYALMGKISATMTRILQEYVRSKFGDPVHLHNGTIERKVDMIRVSVWWSPRRGENYLGIYRANSYHAHGEETLLEIIVDRREWTRIMRDEVGARISGESAGLDEFAHRIVNTFIHEYAHLEQDIRGKTGRLGLIPGRRGRSVPGHEEDLERYLGRTSEIDSHASGAAAEVINGIIRKHARYDARYNYNREWKPENISDEDWNADIMDAISGASYGELPKKEYQKYVIGLDRRFQTLDPTIKDKFLKKVRQRFMRAYIVRLRSYLRPISSKKLSGPVGTLPTE